MTVMDASALLCAFLPDEGQPGAQALIRDHALGRVELRAPALMRYEVCNAILKAERQGRISQAESDQIIAAVAALGIPEAPAEIGETLALAREYGRSAYDAAYLQAAIANGEQLVTGDRRLFNAVGGRLEWVRRIGDWQT